VGGKAAGSAPGRLPLDKQVHGHLDAVGEGETMTYDLDATLPSSS
jgi:hypothetical protein